jgi:hypothetical protein
LWLAKLDLSEIEKTLCDKRSLEMLSEYVSGTS